MNRVFMKARVRCAAAVVVVSGLASGIGPGVASAAAPGARRQEAPAAVYTAQQAAEGRAAYVGNCAACHLADLSGSSEAPPLAGRNFVSTWGARGVKELLDYTAATMPQGASPLSADTYAAVVAYILQRNGAVAGERPLTRSTAEPIERVAAGGDAVPSKAETP